MSEAGMRKRRSSAKPTTSAATGLAFGSSTEHELPTARRKPTASMTRPVTRVNLPLAATASVADATWAHSCTNRLSSTMRVMALCDPAERLAERRGDALPARAQRRIDFAGAGDDAAAAARDRCIFPERPRACARRDFEVAAHDRRVLRVHHHVHGARALHDVAQGFFDALLHDFGPCFECGADELARDGEAELHPFVRELAVDALEAFVERREELIESRDTRRGFGERFQPARLEPFAMPGVVGVGARMRVQLLQDVAVCRSGLPGALRRRGLVERTELPALIGRLLLF